MWNRRESESPSTRPRPAPSPRSATSTASQPAPSAAPAPAPRPSYGGQSTIGEMIQIKGELTGNEDMVVCGRVDGKVTLPEHSLTIGAEARIKAEVEAKTVVVQGDVRGNITAGEKIELTSEAKVQGDLAAPRIVIADGAQFNGTINMPDIHAASAKPMGTAQSEKRETTEQVAFSEQPPVSASTG